MTATSLPTITVLMSVFNGQAYLAEAVQSILDQSFTDFEFLIVDDGSADGTAGILRAQASRDARIRVLTQENRGLIDALNRGVSEARGRYLARMDADDVAMPDRFAKQSAFLDSRPEVGVVGGAVQHIDRTGRNIGVVPSLTDPQAMRERLADNSPIAHPTAVIRRDLLLEIGAYRPAFRYAEDFDLWTRISERAEIANLPDIVLRYRVHGSNISRVHVLGKLESVLLAKASARARNRGSDDPAEDLDGFPDDFMQRFLESGESREWLEREAAPVMAARAVDRHETETARRWMGIVRAGRYQGQQRRMLVEHLVGQSRRLIASHRYLTGCQYFSWAARLRATRAVKALLFGNT